MSTTSPLTLEAVKQRFDAWRSHRGKMGSFPDELWQEAVRLLDHYTPTDIMRELRITTTQLEERRKRHTAEAVNTFVDLEVTNNIKEQRVVETKVVTTPQTKLSESTSSVELRRPDGTTLTIQSLVRSDIQSLVTTFIGEPCYS